MPTAEIKVLQIEFVRGTYSVKVEEAGQYFWPLLDFDSAGRLVDGLCVCEHPRCAHVKAALEAVTRGSFRLHQLFEHHFWHHLFYELSQIATPSPGDFEKTPDGWSLLLGKNSVRLEGSTPETISSILEFADKRPEYNERNSIKFSHLTEKESKEWARGRMGPWLRYQLSVWSDIALKLFFWSQNQDLSYCLSMKEKGEMVFLTLDAEIFEIELALETEHLGVLFSQMHTLDKGLVSSMKWQDNLKQIEAFPPNRFHLLYSPNSYEAFKEMQEWSKDHSLNWSFEEWGYWSGKGLWKMSNEPWPQDLSLHEIVHYLDSLEHTQTLVSGLKTNFEEVVPSYSVAFENDGSMRLGPYLWQPGDLESGHIVFLGKGWIYEPQRGFQKIEGEQALLEHLETKVIPKKKVADYIDRHLDKLIQWAPFEVHTTGLSRQIGYRVHPSKSVEFFDKLEAEEGFHCFGDWFYCPSQGLFHYKSQPHAIKPGTKIAWKDLELFVGQNKHALEDVVGFLAKESPLESEYLKVSWIQGESKVGLEMEPYRIFKLPYRNEGVEWAGRLSFAPKAGFYLHSSTELLPSHYVKDNWIPRSQFDEFWSLNQASLSPFIEKLPKELEPAQNYLLNIHTVISVEEGSVVFEADIKTDAGSTSLEDLMRLSKKTGYYLWPTEAGLIDLHSSLRSWTSALTLTDEGKLSIGALALLRLANMICVETQDKDLAAFLKSSHGEETPLPDLSLLESKLRGYQEIGVRWMWQLMHHGLGALLCDDMGLGKTHQVMALIAAVKKFEPQAPILVVCPTSVLFHWFEKIHQFLPSLEVEIFHGSARALPLSTKPIVVTSYGILRQDEALIKNRWHMVVMDEIQLAKNRRSQVWKACGRIRARHKIGLSGTPIENSLKDLKSIFDVIFPGYLPDDSIFRSEFVHAIEKYRDPEALSRLKKWIHPLVLRRTKSEVLKELPEKVDETSHCGLSQEQKSLYDSVMQTSREPILKALQDENEAVPYMHIFSVLNALKQICNHPACYWRNRQIPAKLSSHQSSKWDLFITLLEEALASGQKVVVFSQYLAQLDLIEEYLHAHHIEYAGLRGQTSRRHEAVERFQKDPKCRVFVASLLAAGLGIDLTAGSVVILYDRWWNASRENQAVDRVHRIGQNRGVQVFRLVALGTLEEKIDEMIQRKAKLLEEVTPVDDPSVLKRFNRKELIEIFSTTAKDSLVPVEEEEETLK